MAFGSPEWIEGVEAERDRIEQEFWAIVDADGPSGLPSDMMEAVAQLTRASRNRDMWKGQCERQAAETDNLRQALANLIVQQHFTPPLEIAALATHLQAGAQHRGNV